MTTYPLPTLGPIINEVGISIPTYNDIYQSLIASFKNIYGSDLYVAPDSQDGQLIAIFAKAIHDSNQAAVAVFQSFSPTYAQGTNLSSLVKINGLQRNISGYSTAVGNVIGTYGATILNGVVKDTNGNLWNLPASVTIPITGEIAVTIVAQKIGSITAYTGEINSIYNPQLGWQAFINTVDASVGAPVESDASLRARQAISTSLPAQTVMDAILASVGNVTGVTRFAGYENDSGITDVNGIPPHSFSIIVEGGSIVDIANAINLKKMPGSQTHGTTSQVAYDDYGLPITINFNVLDKVEIYVDIQVHPIGNFVATTLVTIQEEIQRYINALDIGYDVYAEQLVGSAGLIGNILGKTFKLVSLKQDITPVPTSTADITILYDQAAHVSDLANITISIV